ncbi:MAG: hypothetical protein LIP09_08285 [Bacteroidales bacterium]|nr:hypothetical protein [Bacteroidales bacterium]
MNIAVLLYLLLLAAKSQPVQMILNPGFSAIEDSRDVVDLGLSVDWAVCNVGAKYPWECGDYFAWGETEAKEEYSAGNCITSGKSLGKRQIRREQALPETNDAASVQWGGSWRMPLQQEIDELKNLCMWIPTSICGNPGYQVLGPNGNSIFLPLTGYKKGSKLTKPRQAQYWSNGFGGLFGNEGAYYMNFPFEMDKDNSRYLGRCIRPVDGATVKQRLKIGQLNLPALELLNSDIGNFITKSVQPSPSRGNQNQLPQLLFLDFRTGDRPEEAKLLLCQSTDETWSFSTPLIGAFQIGGFWVVVNDEHNLSKKFFKPTGRHKLLRYKIPYPIFCFDGVREWNFTCPL